MGRRSLIALAVVAVVAGGCGGSSTSEADKPAAQIVKDAVAAIKDAKGVHMTGTFVSSGKRIALTLDLGQASGKGTMAQGAARADVARVGDVSYIRANSAFWQLFAGSGAALLLHDRWLSGSTSKPPLSAFARFLSIDALLREAFTGTGSHKLKKLGTRTYKGQKVIAIADPQDHETLLIAAEGTPYPIAATGQGTIDFSQWNKDVSVTAPKGATDITGLGG
jgi:hypothetical protein